ncbi:hypothetical protein PRZ48_012836 [Zasmidium cellare]|uniref:Uncharacterized protein n=1 Tax=Zasmidium cellare TaxID=395010 RepID=A0ABR0E364_ZASCE|nr:hypothetical protein PRZ48_012836 [Zasmidium cellare]
MAIKMANEKIEAKVLAAEKSFYEDLEAAKQKSASSAKTTTPKPLPFHDTTKSYWAVMAFFTTLAIISAVSVLTVVRSRFAFPLLLFVDVWAAFMMNEFFRGFLGQNHATRATCTGVALIAVILASTVVVEFVVGE